MSTVYHFHQMPIVNTANFTAQYHVIIRVAISARGDVLWSSAITFLVSLQPRPNNALEDQLDDQLNDLTHKFSDQT